MLGSFTLLISLHLNYIFISPESLYIAKLLCFFMCHHIISLILQKITIFKCIVQISKSYSCATIHDKIYSLLLL